MKSLCEVWIELTPQKSIVEFLIKLRFTVKWLSKLSVLSIYQSIYPGFIGSPTLAHKIDVSIKLNCESVLWQTLFAHLILFNHSKNVQHLNVILKSNLVQHTAYEKVTVGVVYEPETGLIYSRARKGRFRINRMSTNLKTVCALVIDVSVNLSQHAVWQIMVGLNPSVLEAKVGMI